MKRKTPSIFNLSKSSPTFYVCQSTLNIFPTQNIHFQKTFVSKKRKSNLIIYFAVIQLFLFQVKVSLQMYYSRTYSCRRRYNFFNGITRNLRVKWIIVNRIFAMIINNCLFGRSDFFVLFLFSWFHRAARNISCAHTNTSE